MAEAFPENRIVRMSSSKKVAHNWQQFIHTDNCVKGDVKKAKMAFTILTDLCNGSFFFTMASHKRNRSSYMSGCRERRPANDILSRIVV